MPNFFPAFQLESQYRDYVWGGTLIRPGQVTAEAWVVHEDNQILSGPLTGRTLGSVASEFPLELLGSQVVARTGARFPLLIKLLDCAQWLSVQVHPNNEQAVALEGPGKFGKTEAWHILKADPGAEILCGFHAGSSVDAIHQAVREGSILDVIQRLPMQTGDTVFIPAGTVHALGPGLLVYEVQQSSDITYRVFDWNRPASAGRKLHISQSLAVLDPAASATPQPEPSFKDPGLVPLVNCPFFDLKLITLAHQPTALDTGQKTFHSLTVIEGSTRVAGQGWEIQSNQFETLLIPASTGQYIIEPLARTRVLVSSLS